MHYDVDFNFYNVGALSIALIFAVHPLTPPYLSDL